MKKVLILVTKSNWGGAQRYVYDLATHLPKGQFEPLVVCGPAQGSTTAGPLVDRLVQSGVRTILVSELQRDIGTSESDAIKALWRIVRSERPDVLHLNSSKAGVWGALVGRLTRTPRIVFTAHGWAFRESRNPLWQFIAWGGSMLTVLLCHRIICVSNSDLQAAPRFFRHKCVTIHNAVPTDTLLYDRESARDRLIALGIPSSQRTSMWIGIVAEHTANKDLSTALRAFAIVHTQDPETARFLILIGEGEETAKLMALARELQIDTAVHFAGFIPNASLYLAAFDAVLLTSLKEGLPYIILESLAAGVPVIASNVGGIPEIISDGKNGLLCPPSDSAAFAKALIAIPTLAKSRVTAASFESMLQQTFLEY